MDVDPYKCRISFLYETKSAFGRINEFEYSTDFILRFSSMNKSLNYCTNSI